MKKNFIYSLLMTAVFLLFLGGCSEDRQLQDSANDSPDSQNKLKSAPGVTISNGTYKITSVLSNKVIEVAGGGTSNGANVQQWTYLGLAHQKWVVTNRGDNWYSLSPSHAINKALDVSGISTADGANVHSWDYLGGYNQLFKFVPASNGYNIVARHSDKCLDIYNFSTSDGGNIVQWTIGSNQSNQMFTLENLSGSSGASCNIDGNVSHQMIDGIGFSSAWCGTLTDAKNNALYNTLGFSLLRVRFDQNNNWTDERNNATAAHARGAKVLGCPWMIPDAYKSGSTVPFTVASSQYGNYCNWLRDAANYINCDFVSIKNEPDMYNSVDGNLTGEQIRIICRDYAQNIGKPIVVADAVGFGDSYTDPTLNDATAASHITYVGGHLYGNGNYVHQNALNKGKRVWMTEYYIENSRDNMDQCIVLAKNISDVMNNQMSAYFFWWVYDADASVNLVNQSGTIYKSGYTGGQFAKWIRPGKVRIGCTYNPTPNIYVTAYRNGGIVVVAINQGTTSVNQTFSFQNISGLTTMNVHRTSSSENLASKGTVTLSNNAFTYTLPAKSVTTFHQF